MCIVSPLAYCSRTMKNSNSNGVNGWMKGVEVIERRGFRDCIALSYDTSNDGEDNKGGCIRLDTKRNGGMIKWGMQLEGTMSWGTCCSSRPFPRIYLNTPLLARSQSFHCSTSLQTSLFFIFFSLQNSNFRKCEAKCATRRRWRWTRRNDGNRATSCRPHPTPAIWFEQLNKKLSFKGLVQTVAMQHATRSK